MKFSNIAKLQRTESEFTKQKKKIYGKINLEIIVKSNVKDVL